MLMALHRMNIIYSSTYAAEKKSKIRLRKILEQRLTSTFTPFVIPLAGKALH